jgi:hypothetical protein
MANDNLYVVKRTFLNLKSPSGLSLNVALPATFTDLKAAKAEAKTTLFNEGYEKDFFSLYDVNDGQSEWKHGSGTIVYAEALSGEVFKVEIETVPNSTRLEGDQDGRVRRPLHHVLQTDVHFNEDRSGFLRDSAIESTHTVRELAKAKALTVLLDQDVKKEDFAEYDEYADGTEGPFGPDVMVHAVKEGGENILVSVVSDYHV